MIQLPKFIYYILAFIALLFVGNMVLLDYFMVGQSNNLADFQTRVTQIAQQRPTIISPSAPTTPQPTLVDTCPQSCVAQIINATRAAAVRQALTPITTPATGPIIGTSQKGEYFINLGSGSVLNSEANGSNWKTIDSAQATFDASNYGSIKSASVEIFMHVQSGGEVHGRLFDATTPNVFWNTDLVTTSLMSTFLSAPISLYSGPKTYKIQMYSTLTTGYLDQARIHIVTQ